MLSSDLNPIHDLGSPRSTAGMKSAVNFFDYLEIDLKSFVPDKELMDRWGEEGLNRKTVIASWELTIFDHDKAPCSLLFDLISGDSYILIGVVEVDIVSRTR